jgi:hypothetical protein
MAGFLGSRFVQHPGVHELNIHNAVPESDWRDDAVDECLRLGGKYALLLACQRNEHRRNQRLLRGAKLQDCGSSGLHKRKLPELIS